MQWTDVLAAPSQKKLRQFAFLWIAFFLGLAIWRALHSQQGAGAWMLAAIAVVVGGLGMVQPAVIRPVYTGWMIAAFPIGWTVSRLMLGVLFFGIFTPVAAIFKSIRRDALRIRRGDDRETYWTEQPTNDMHSYFRQF
jgi:hypothetical protein